MNKNGVTHLISLSLNLHVMIFNFIEIYLRNKETQQTLRVIENIQYDASF